MWLHNNIIFNDNLLESVLIIDSDERMSCSIIDAKVQRSRENQKEPSFIALTYSQWVDLTIELRLQQRFIDTIEVKDLSLDVYRGIPILTFGLELMKCPLCNGFTWKRNYLIYSCDKHYKQILAMNKLAVIN